VAYNRPIPEKKERGMFGLSLDAVVQAEKMIQIALLLPSAAFIGWLMGAWLAGKLHTKWIGPAGIVFGGVAGLVGAVRMAVAAGKTVKIDETAPEPGKIHNGKDESDR